MIEHKSVVCGAAMLLALLAAGPLGGYIVRLTPDGREILSTRRVAAMVLDLAIDANDNIYVAAWTDGALKLDRTDRRRRFRRSAGSLDAGEGLASRRCRRGDNTSAARLTGSMSHGRAPHP